MSQLASSLTLTTLMKKICFTLILAVAQSIMSEAAYSFLFVKIISCDIELVLSQNFQISRQFSAHGDDDGVFWIAFEDVLRYFDCIDICKVRRGWSETRVSGILPNHSSKQHQSCTLLTVLEPTEVEFSLFQEGQR